MSDVINISDLQFNTSSIEEVSEKCISKNKCALIISENDVTSMMSKSKDVVGKSVNQIIIISEDLSSVSNAFEGINVLLISAKSLEEAVQLSVTGEYSEEVIYVSNNGGDDLKQVIKSLES